MLLQHYGDDLLDLLLPREQGVAIPPAQDRAAWEALSAAARGEAIALGERHLGFAWPALPATLFLQFAREGNRSRYEHESFARRSALGALVAAECCEGRGRFLDDVVNGIWAICEESFWGVPAHNEGQPLPDVERPIFDLFAGETGALLAWTHHLLRARLDSITPHVAARIRLEVARRVTDPFLERDDFWWMGLGGKRHLNNWTPWCTSNALAAGLLLEDDPARRTAVVGKAMGCLDRFLDAYPADGGCDEGTGYWDRAGGAVFDCLELLHAASGGAIDLYGEPLVQEMGRYLYRAHIAGEWFVNFADGGARVHISADLVHRYGQRIGDAALRALGAAARHEQRRRGGSSVQGPLPRLLPALFNFARIEAEAARTVAAPHIRDAWLPDVQVMTARQRAGTAQGLFLAAKGGHNNESHNHNDVGQFIVYADGLPAIVDVGVETYTAKTFSGQRYSIWTMRSTYHNLPTVRGVEQRAGQQFRASGLRYRADEATAELAMDIGGAYPPEAGIVAWRRTVRLVREGLGAVEVIDDFRLTEPTDDVWLSLMLCREPLLDTEGVLALSGAPSLRVLYDGAALVASAEAIAVEDPRLRGVWGQQLWRVVLRARGPVSEETWRLAVERGAV